MVLEAKYKKCVVEFMSFRDGEAYDVDKVFTPQELSTITPVEIKQWRSQNVYGVTALESMLHLHLGNLLP